MGDSGIGFDIDAGNEQHIDDILFHHNTTNIDDEVGDHVYNTLSGHFPIALAPADLDGIAVATHVNAATWGDDVEIRAAGAKPFRIVASHLEPNASEWFRVRFTDGTTYYDELLFDANKREGIAAPSGTEFIFNKGIAISASAQCETGGKSVQVWIEVQEI